jgi:acyl-CoA dehydrogenase
MISFAPTEEQRLMVGSVADFARTVLRPRTREFERDRAIPEAVRRTGHELGLALAALPELVGGPGLGLTTAVLLEEELAWGDPSARFALGGPGALGLAVTELGTVEQATAALAPFLNDPHRFGAVAWGETKPRADRPGFTTTATPTTNGFRLDGAKSYVLSAEHASSFVVFAQVEESAGWRGVGAFLVERGASGFDVGPRVDTLGLDAASFGSITLDGVLVPASARLLGGGDADRFTASLVRFFAKNALLTAAASVGLARAAFDATRDYVDSRKAFGKTIGHFQAVAFNLADRAIDVDASRGLVWRAASAWDGEAPEKEALRLTAHAVSFAHDAAMRCGDDAVQLHGGAGFMRDYLVEKLMRDARQIGLYGMTAEHADQLAAALDVGVPVDPAVVLPTPETQNAFV